MASATDPVHTAILRQSPLAEVVRFTAFKREGSQLLRTLQRGLDDPEALAAVRGVRDQILQGPGEGRKAGRTVGFLDGRIASDRAGSEAA